MTPLRGLTKLRSTVNTEAPPAASGELTAEQRAESAREIILAGKIRRGEIVIEREDLSAEAKAILRAGRVRRGEEQA